MVNLNLHDQDAVTLLSLVCNTKIGIGSAEKQRLTDQLECALGICACDLTVKDRQT